ncbi:MAG: TetR/AcrR family transcriptional regulator [Aminipila sp.]
MKQKGERTKEEILNTAKKLFTEKGFSTITMSDMCEATGLSRGGLYRHFSSTEEIFIALLEADKDDWQSEMDRAMKNNVSAIQMMTYYLEQIQNVIAQGGGGLSLAIYEYMRNREGESNFLDTRYDFAVNMMKALLYYGQQRGEFKPCNIQTEAEHLVIFLDGLQTASAVITFSEEVVSRQIEGILQRIKSEGRE